MHNTARVVDDIYYIGASNRLEVRFENMFPLTEGISYNSYLIVDEKTVVLDTVDSSVSAVFLENIEYVLNGRNLDYLVINHMEPDHCANIENLIRRYPNVTVIGNAKTFKFLEQFYPLVPEFNKIIVKDGDSLSLGKHELKFILAPMVHWPEVMVTYESTTKTLFSSDAFGNFGALNGNLFSDELEFNFNEFRRYYSNVIGRFGVNVNALFKKINLLEINQIASLHGPIHRKNMVNTVLSKYQTWANYQPEEQGVVIAYASMYGNTAEVCHKLATHLGELGIRNIQIFDVSNQDASYIIEKVFKYSNLVIASVNYNTKLYYPMHFLLEELSSLNIANRKVSFITNATWGGTALATSKEIILKNKNMIEIGESFEIKSSMTEEQCEILKQLALDIKESMQEGK